jgi:hypothetical protein
LVNLAEIVADLMFRRATFSWKGPMFLAKLSGLVFLLCAASRNKLFPLYLANVLFILLVRFFNFVFFIVNYRIGMKYVWAGEAAYAINEVSIMFLIATACLIVATWYTIKPSIIQYFKQ